jgi:hypothetical protein
MSSYPNLFIDIDDFRFSLKNKKILRDEYDNVSRYFIDFISKNNITKEEINLTAYTSISEIGCLRVCFTVNDSISKFDNYVQSTIIDLRLQKFIFDNIDLIPVKDFSELIPCPKQNEESKKIIQDRFESLNILERNSIDKLEDISSNNNIDTNLTINKIQPNTLPSLSMTPSLSMDPSLSKPPSSNIPPSLSMNHSSVIPSSNIHWNENNFDIIDSENVPVGITTKISNLKIDYMTYNIQLENIVINNNLFGIRIKNKYDKSIVIVIIGHCKITIVDTSINREGYYVFNLVPENYKINAYGLYDRYYNDSEDGYSDYNPIDYYITKPLEYGNQINFSQLFNFNYFFKNEYKELDISNRNYDFIAQYNKYKFIIKQLIKEKSVDIIASTPMPKEGNSYKEKSVDIIASTPMPKEGNSYKEKYLKYKNKYLSLKNKLEK